MARAALVVGGALLVASAVLVLFGAEAPEQALRRLRGAEPDAAAPRALTESEWHRHGYRGRYRRRYGRRWGRRCYGWRCHRYGWGGHRHRHGWHHWYALPGLEKADKSNVDNADFWPSVFADPKLLSSFAESVVEMDAASRQAWEQSVYAQAQEEARGPAALWEDVFADKAATLRFASWLAELGVSGRMAWERRVSAALVGEGLSPWQPSWEGSWGTRPETLVTAQRWGHHHHHGHWGHHHGHWGHHGHHGHWGHHHHYHGHHGGRWHGWYALPEVKAAQGEAQPVSNADFWAKVFGDEDLLEGFAAWLGDLEEEARKSWEQRMPAAASSDEVKASEADVEKGPLAALWEEATDADDSTDIVEGKDVEQPDLEDAATEFAGGFWEGVFEDDKTASSFAAWLAEMSDTDRQAWERSVSEAASAATGKAWRPSWPQRWAFGDEPSPAATTQTAEQAAQGGN